jgi:hypothetical protein
MAASNVPPPSNQTQTTTTYVADMDARARKRAAIGLEPDRATAPAEFQRPPDESSGCAQWLLVWCVVLLGLAILLLLVSRVVNPSTTLASLLGVSGPSATTTPAATPTQPSADGALPAYLAQLPGFRLWMSDDFAAPSAIAAPQSVPGQVQAAVAADVGVYRMQVSPNQMGWTLFDLGGGGAHHLESSATVSSETPNGAAGLIARFGGPGNFYLLTVDGRGTANVQLWLNREPLTVQSASVAANPAGMANRLAVEDDGTRLRFYVNQVLVSEIVEPVLGAERPGIAAVASGPDPAIVDFDWIAIYRPE